VPDLSTLGWDAEWASAFEQQTTGELVPGRVSVQHRGAYDVLTATGELRARASGRVVHEAASPADLPVVGDWVAVDPATSTPSIRAVLPRRTIFSRRAAAQDTQSDAAREQVIAANVDVLFVASALGEDVHVGVLERYLTLAWESGARPVILLTKADLEEDPDAVLSDLQGLGDEVPVLAVSARTGFGLDAVRSYLPPGKTGALLGPSGAGKSTLVNALAREALLETGDLGRRGGRHTTTRRQLVPLPGAGVLIDNPGMREVHLWLTEQGLEDAFPEIAELETECRFSDCSHETEPGCAIRAALADGRLAAERWTSYRKLRAELAELDEKLAHRERTRDRRGRRGAAGA
jgi:ribosome biogenesis GTPase / thiamine phosphate phosphatase